jgi:regulator of replication initiation timing
MADVQVGFYSHTVHEEAAIEPRGHLMDFSTVRGIIPGQWQHLIEECRELAEENKRLKEENRKLREEVEKLGELVLELDKEPT